MRTQGDVLLVDDDADELGWMTLALGAGGLSVTTAAGVDQAIACLDRCHPRLIIAGLGMPAASGWDLLRYLRDDPLLRAVPVMVVGGVPLASRVPAADAVLSKPVMPEVLLATARSLLRD